MSSSERWYPGSLSDEMTPMEREHIRLSREFAAQSMVLLQNDGTLPLSPGQRVAVYGFGARHTVKGGTGSGGVNNRHTDCVDEGLRDAGLVVTNTAWLDDFDRRYAQARQDWEARILAMAAGQRGSMALYRAHAANPMQSPESPAITREADTEVALYVLCRVSGEGADRKNAPGDYQLSESEWSDLRTLTALYPKVVLVLNVGGIVDLSVLEELPITAVLLMGQAGMSGGYAAADVLTGAVNPSGRLTDTWAWHYADYPSSAAFSHNSGNIIQEFYKEGLWVGYRYFDAFDVPVRYPFGHGLSYTRFAVEPLALRTDGNGCVTQEVRVTNTGSTAGRDAVQLYVSCPGQVLPREKRKLAAFAKTRLLAPGESEVLCLSFPLSALEMWHTARAAWLIEAGDTYVLVGEDIAHTRVTGTLRFEREHTAQQLKNICPVQDAFKEIQPPADGLAAWRDACAKVAEGLPVLTLDDAVTVRPTPAYEAQPLLRGEAQDEALQRVVGGLTDLQKAQLCCGQPKAGDAEFIGSAAVTLPGAAGETTHALAAKGIDPVILADGPAGLRVTQKYQLDDSGTPIDLSWEQKLLNRFFGHEFLQEDRPIHYTFCSAVPVGSLLAQSFDTALLEAVGELIRKESELFHVTLWLAPGMNIHRNPLCGRNFEYYSEDPLVSGLMAAAITRGVQSSGKVGTTIKHFACNNQEENRMGVDSIVSERTLRELYLKGFEIAIRLAQPMAIMTSYNKVNGVHTANSHDLCSDAARSEWGFRGLIMTDWTTTNGNGSSAVRCIQAGNDLVMPGTQEDLRELLDARSAKFDSALAQSDLDACALRMLSMMKRTGHLHTEG